MMNLSELDIQVARERYNDQIVAARISRLIREAQAAQQPVARPARNPSLFARVLAALRTRPAVHT
jgi:hypothetical protein